MNAPADVAQGHRDEALAGSALRAHGWTVLPWGQDQWATTPALVAAIQAEQGELRHGPDLLVARGRDLWFVEVVNCPGHVDRALEIAKCAAADYWARMHPYWVLDVADWHVVGHVPVAWAYTIVDGPTRYTNGGSGDPYAWFSRQHDQWFEDVFR